MAATNDLVFKTAAELGQIIKAKKASPVEITRAYLDRVEALNPKLNAIITPAASNGVFGIKPTYGRVSRYGASALGWTLDHIGPMTKTVTDAALMLRVIAGQDPKDATSSSETVPDYTRGLTRNIKGMRI